MQEGDADDEAVKRRRRKKKKKHNYVGRSCGIGVWKKNKKLGIHVDCLLAFKGPRRLELDWSR
jgi:hypothetical protein